MSATGGAQVPQQRVPSRDEVIADAGAWLAETCDRLDAMSPLEQAKAAYKDGGPSVPELEARIRAMRGLPPVAERGAA